MDIWNFQRKLTNRLLAWSVFSMVVGWGMWLDSHKPIRAAGQQFFYWGLIDGLIAVFGRASAAKRTSYADPLKETRKLQRILGFNCGLDLLYMLGGIHQMKKDDAHKRGQGVGILIQGAFLFFFDLIHVLLIAYKSRRTAP